MSFFKFLLVLLIVVGAISIAIEALQMLAVVGIGAVAWCVWRLFYKTKRGAPK